MRTFFLTLLLAPLPAFAAATVSHPFRGVTLTHVTQSAPVPLSIHLVHVDLADPGISFRLTPPNGDLPRETTHQTTRSFLAEQQAQLAINTTFYGPLNELYADNVGLAVSDGVAYSPFEGNWPAFNISADNAAAVVNRTPGDPTGTLPTPSVPLYNAFGGNEQIITAGLNTASDNNLHPRTAIGLTADNKLVLFTVDGRQSASAGMTTLQVADFLLSYGVVNALNLDGGGSTTLAIADPLPRLVNVPVGLFDIPGTERPNGANLAIFAAPIPEPSVSFVLLLAGMHLVQRRSRVRGCSRG